MGKPGECLAGRCCAAIRALNYEQHLTQHGIVRFGRAHPWLGVVPTMVGGALGWIAFWTLYAALIVLLVLCVVAYPLEQIIRGRSVL